LTAYAIRRILGLIPVLFGVSLLVFAIPRLVPGDPAVIMLGERSSEVNRERLREQLGLNRPLFINIESARENGIRGLADSQYLEFIGNLLQGDLGTSIFRFIPVREGLMMRFPATFELAVFAMLIAVVVGIPAGVIAAIRRGTLVDTGIMFAALAGVSFPVFWLGIILIYTFAVNLGWLPSSGRIGVSVSTAGGTGFYVLDAILQGRWDFLSSALRHLILPGIALGTIPLAIVVRMTRSAMLEVLGQDYIRTASAKGLSEQLVVRKHALRNALLPVVTVIGLSFGTLLSGAILTETVFSWPGIGSWIYQAISSRDYPIIQGGVMFVAFMFVLVNLLVDLSYALIDPRIQYS
jgi:peptide/nickel transport system permease protein